MSKLEVFKSEIQIFNYTKSLISIEKKTDVIIQKLKSNHIGDLQGHVYHSDSISELEEVEPLKQEIQWQTIKMLQDQGYDLQKYTLKFEEIWVQEFGPTGFHKNHVHGNCHISGFYFINVDEKSPKCVFTDPRSGKQMTQLPEKDESQLTMASQHINITPFPGMLLLFNSYLPHHFTINKSDKPFRFIHFNIAAKA